MRGGSGESQGASWWKAWLEGCSYTGSVPPPVGIMWAWRMVSSNKPEKKGFNLHLHQSYFPAEFHISLQQFAGWELRAGRGVQSWMRALWCASCRGQPLLITALTAGKSKAFISVFLHAGHSHQCFCLPATTSKTCEYIFCFLHLLVLHFCWHTCKYHHVCFPSF